MSSYLFSTTCLMSFISNYTISFKKVIYLICYIYDGSFEGLLTSIYEAYYNRQNPEYIVTSQELIPSLLLEYVQIATDVKKSNKVYSAIRDKISEETLENIFYIYISETENLGKLILDYVRLGFKLGRDLNSHLYDDTVLEVHKICRRVTHEANRMTGFVRFSSIGNNTYYAPIEPDSNILSLLAPHFAERFSDQNWIIHDIKRKQAALYNTHEWIIMDVNDDAAAKLCAVNRDGFYENLWADYFNNMAIQSRINPRLQRQHVPVRYRKYLTEFKL